MRPDAEQETLSLVSQDKSLKGQLFCAQPSFSRFIDVCVCACVCEKLPMSGKRMYVCMFVYHLFIHSDYFYSTSLSPLLLRQL